MNDLGGVRMAVARKQHRCAMCCYPIAKGERHAYMHGMYDGEWQNWHAHAECNEAFQLDGDTEFVSGTFEPPQRLRSGA